ncbi:MAG: hypothetical protein MHM6MM_005508, partial [Cercozoa sp. M6MM]
CVCVCVCAVLCCAVLLWCGVCGSCWASVCVQCRTVGVSSGAYVATDRAAAARAPRKRTSAAGRHACAQVFHGLGKRPQAPRLIALSQVESAHAVQPSKKPWSGSLAHKSV